MNKFILPIWDWSADGHWRCDYFPIESTLTYEELKEAYTSINSVLHIGDISSDYEDSMVLIEDVEKLSKAWINIDDWLPNSSEKLNDEWDQYYIEDTQNLAKLVVAAINLKNPNSTKLVQDDTVILNFGFDLPWYWMFD